MNNHFDVSVEGAECSRANNSAGVGFVDCDMRFGAEKTPAACFDSVEDGGFVGAENLSVAVPHAGMVDVEKASGQL